MKILSSPFRWMVVLFCATLFTSCSPQEDRASANNEITLIFTHAKHPRYAELSKLVRDFEAENPGIRIAENVIPSSTDEQHQFYVINLAGGAADFDLLDMDVIWVPEFARAGWLLDITGAIPADELAPLHKGALRADTLDGRLYGVPWFVDAGVLYYRADLLEKHSRRPPETYIELAETARVIQAAENNPRLAGFLWQGMQYEGLVCAALEVIRGNGGDLLDAAGRPRLTAPRTVAALRQMEAWIRTERITPELVTTLNEEASRHIFQSGRAIFMRNWPYAWKLLNQEGSPVRGRVGVIPAPHFPGGESSPTLGGFHLGVNRRSRHPEAALKFVRYMIRKESQKRILLDLGVLPAHMAVYDDAEAIAAVPQLPRLRPAVARAQPRPVTPYYLMISQIIQPELSAVVAGIRSPEDAMQSAQKQVEHLLGRQ